MPTGQTTSLTKAVWLLRRNAKSHEGIGSPSWLSGGSIPPRSRRACSAGRSRSSPVAALRATLLSNSQQPRAPRRRNPRALLRVLAGCSGMSLTASTALFIASGSFLLPNAFGAISIISYMDDGCPGRETDS